MNEVEEKEEKGNQERQLRLVQCKVLTAIVVTQEYEYDHDYTS